MNLALDTRPAALVAILVFLVELARAQDANCTYSQYVQPELQPYYINSPNYPGMYGKGWNCLWNTTCPTNNNCKLDCQVEMPQSNNCAMDRLLVSRSGYLGLGGTDVYCGTGNLSIVSTGAQISVGLRTSQNSTLGRFACMLTTQPGLDNSPPQSHSQTLLHLSFATGVNL